MRLRASVCVLSLKDSPLWTCRMRIDWRGDFLSMMLSTRTFRLKESESSPPSRSRPDQRSGLFAFARCGLVGVCCGSTCFGAGLSSFLIGLVVAAGLTGSALATIIVSLAADRLGRRQSLLVLSLLTGISECVALSPRSLCF